MVYFFINLCFHLLVSVGLLLVILHFVANNKKQKNKKGIFFLLPAVLTVVFLFQALAFTAPRIMDSVYVLKQSYQTVSGRADEVKYMNHALQIKGETYYYNPFMLNPKVGDIYDVSYTPYAHYALTLVPSTVDKG
jgi:hypothetical protein